MAEGTAVGGRALSWAVSSDIVTWRWCFYINLPIGGATVAGMIPFFNFKKMANARRGFFERLIDLDLVGNVLIIGARIMLFIALRRTTQGTARSSAEFIGLLVGCGVVAIPSRL
ncbi:putative HC-toxin efflux carrier TOXA [Madurella mycetomatis]|uniref:HC-toxin efflux carrier TOXA n=1 Tax=Madurella mycetomatis TaxID=100816 RepID=A0A175W350_9PEZI|nr:putative HC-toxin efflux carrier TOXA [Madurella mycetomatis]